MKYPDICPKFRFSSKSLIFDQNFELYCKIYIVNQNFNFCRFLSKISIFVQNFDFYPKFRFLSKISIFVQSFDFLQYFDFSPKITIFNRSFDLIKITVVTKYSKIQFSNNENKQTKNLSQLNKIRISRISKHVLLNFEIHNSSLLLKNILKLQCLPPNSYVL